MKKVLLLSAAVAFSAPVMAKDYGAAGCGVGSILFEGQSGLGPHVLAATTNGFYGTQTFAMTSGTLGCDVEGTIHSHSAFNYINDNMETVASAIAQGEGEALLVLGDLFQVEAADQAQFAETLRQNFAAIYPNVDVTSEHVVSSIVNALAANASLQQYAG